MLKQCFILVIAILICHGQVVDFFFPAFAKANRKAIDGLTKSPLVTLPSQVSGDFLSSAVRAAAMAPEAITRALGVGNLPGIFPDSDTNIFGALDNFLGDYNAGVGNEDAVLDIRTIIRKYGYPLENHKVITEDGYVLSMFRIPGNGSSVFLMHGLLGCADDYIVAGPESGLAYLLADEGYDVWMGNARGSKHSRRHVELKPSQAKFWDFTWHEIGVYDLPAMIDSVLDETGLTSLKYIGHSQGTTSFFVMTSERPEYNEKISLMVALSPVVFMSNLKSPVVRLMAAGTPLIHRFVKTVGLYEFLPDNIFMRTLKSVMCGGGVLSDIVCTNMLFMMAGIGFAQFNFTNLPVLMGHTPAGASSKQLIHYGQGVLTGKFRQFDYGSALNFERYGRETPPNYSLKNVTAPISLVYSDADWLAHPDDVDKLYNKLDSVIDIHKIPCDQFNHLDFLWAKDFKVLVYKRLRKLLSVF